MSGNAAQVRLRDRLEGALRDLAEMEADHARALSAVSDDATVYWRRRALRAEGTREAAMRGTLGLAAERLLTAAVRLGEARYAGDLASRNSKPVNMNSVWRQFRGALKDYAGTPDDRLDRPNDEAES